jgi:hypothetical protein
VVEESAGALARPAADDEHDPRIWSIALLMELATHYAEVALPILGEGLQSAVQLVPDSVEAVLSTEAWLCVGGLAASQLSVAGFDVIGWTQSALSCPTVQLAQQVVGAEIEGVPASAIVGRRLAWLLGTLATKGAPRSRQMAAVPLLPDEAAIGLMLADSMLHWLGRSENMAVRCTAVAALHHAVGGIPAVAGALMMQRGNGGGEKANAAVERLLAIAVDAHSPTLKWQSVNGVLQLLKVGAVTGSVVESSLLLIRCGQREGGARSQQTTTVTRVA